MIRIFGRTKSISYYESLIIQNLLIGVINYNQIHEHEIILRVFSLSVEQRSGWTIKPTTNDKRISTRIRVKKDQPANPNQLAAILILPATTTDPPAQILFFTKVDGLFVLHRRCDPGDAFPLISTARVFVFPPTPSKL